MKNIATQTSQLHKTQPSAERLIHEGWQMAEKEGVGAIESIELRHRAEAKSAEVVVKNIQAEGHIALQHRDDFHAKLRELGFSIAEHVHQIARGRVDLIQAVGLCAVSVALALFTLLAFGSVFLSCFLSLAILGSLCAIEEFFEAYSRCQPVREGIFLAASVLALLGQFWLGVVRGKLATMMVDAGPVSHLLAEAGPIIQNALGLLAIVIEILCGWKAFRARRALLSPTARAFREREQLNARLIHLGRALETAQAGPDIRRQYRVIGMRQQLAHASAAEQRKQAAHLREAAKGALVALVILALLLLLSSRMAASPNPAQREVVLLDLSRSVTSESLRANLDSVTVLIGRLQAGQRLTVVPITDRFGVAPLMDETMPREAGYQGLQGKAAREVIAAKWRTVSKMITPPYGQTDVLGAITTVSYLDNFSASGTRLYVFSDMQQHTRELDLERDEQIDVPETIARLKRTDAIPSLLGFEVIALGVDPVGKSARSYATLRKFWFAYFREAGASIRFFGIDHRIPEF